MLTRLIFPSQIKILGFLSKKYIILDFIESHIAGFFSPALLLQEQQNFRNLEFRREILEFSEKSFQFDGGNLEFPLSLEEKS